MVLRDKFDCGVSLLCWAYNEEDSIGEFLSRATDLMDSAVDDYEIILIDDGSTDGTYDTACLFQKTHPALKIFRNGKNLNVAASFKRALQMASKEYVFWQTVDWSYDIAGLREYLEYLKQYNIVQGVRRMRGLKRRSDTVGKAVVSIINYRLIRFLFRMPLSDFQNVTFYPIKWLQSMKVEANSSFANPEMLLKSYWSGMTIKEVPIGFIPREKGLAKGTRVKAIMNSVKDILRLWFKWVVLGGRGKIKKGKIYGIQAMSDGQ